MGVGKARYLLLGALTSSLFKDGSVQKPAEGKSSEASDHQIWTHQMMEESEEPDEGQHEDQHRQTPTAASRDAMWRKVLKDLQEPVELLFCEPVGSKKAPVGLRALQRIYTRFRLEPALTHAHSQTQRLHCCQSFLLLR